MRCLSHCIRVDKMAWYDLLDLKCSSQTAIMDVKIVYGYTGSSELWPPNIKNTQTFARRACFSHGWVSTRVHWSISISIVWRVCSYFLIIEWHSASYMATRCRTVLLIFYLEVVRHLSVTENAMTCLHLSYAVFILSSKYQRWKCCLNRSGIQTARLSILIVPSVWIHNPGTHSVFCIFRHIPFSANTLPHLHLILESRGWWLTQRYCVSVHSMNSTW